MGLREVKKQRTRQEMLDVARALFLKRGFDGTRVRDIAAKLGVSEQTVFNYFPSKQALVEAIAEQWAATMATRVAKVPQAPPRPGGVLAFGRNALIRYLVGMAEDRALLRLLLDHSAFGQAQPTRRPPAPGDSALLRASRAQLQAMATGYRFAQAGGELRGDVDPLELAEMVSAVIATCLRTWVDTEPPPDFVELVVRRVGLLMDGARIGPPLDVRQAVAEARSGI